MYKRQVSWNRRHDTKAQRHKKLIEAMEMRDLEKSLEILKEDIENLKQEILEEFC